MILPRVKSEKQNNGYFTKKLLISPCFCEKENVLFLLNCFCPTLKAETGETPTLDFKRAENMRCGEYRLCVSEDGISVKYGDYEGLRNAIASLSFLVSRNGISCRTVSDYPDNPFRAVLIDLARGYVEIPILREHIVRMAKLKYNILHLHLMDRQSYCIESDVVPNPDGHRLYSKEDMRNLVKFATRLGLEVIPEIEFPAHARNQLRAIPSLACDIIDKRAAMEKVRAATNPYKLEFIDADRCVSAWTVCIGKDETYQTYEKIIRELAEIFRGKYFHVGGDEFEFLHIAAHPHWDNCHACRKKMAKEGFSDTLELYYYGLCKLHKLLASLGKRMMVWNDQLDVFKPIDIPKDTVIYFWRGDLITKEAGVFQALLDQGFEVVNAHYPYTYLDMEGEMDGKNIAEWTTRTEFLEKDELRGNILGGMMSAWSLGAPAHVHNKYVIPVGMALFCDRVWNNAKTEYDRAYREALFSAISGENDTRIDAFTFFADIIPPRSGKSRSFLEDVDLDKINVTELDFTIEKLADLDLTLLYGKRAAEEIKKLLLLIRAAI